MTDESKETPNRPFAAATGSETGCEWHKHDRPLVDDEQPGCSNCGSAYHTTMCPVCEEYFIDWRSKGWDDVFAAPYVTCSGDLYCVKCGPGRDRAEEEAGGDNDFGDWPP